VQVTDRFPSYYQLPAIARTGARHAWGLFGPNDELGTLNFISAESIRQAAGEVRLGLVVNLNLPLDLPSPSLAQKRRLHEHHVSVGRRGRDDHLDSFYLQASTQWDGLQHIRYREFGYYGGREEPDLDRGELGIDRIAQHGMIARGVLADVAGCESEHGAPIDPRSRFEITPDHLDAALRNGGVETRDGDVLLLRTGWLGWYLSLDQAARAALAATMHPAEGGLDCPGLGPPDQIVQWLWDHRIAAVAADNPTLEVVRVDPAVGDLHRLLIPLLGMPIGELWMLDELADACRRHGRHSFLLSAMPLRLASGVGSPANAQAVL
jgi:kynurenine formamidase